MGLEIGDQVWNQAVFNKNRDRRAAHGARCLRPVYCECRRQGCGCGYRLDDCCRRQAKHATHFRSNRAGRRAGPLTQGEFAGLDQANLGPLLPSPSGRGDIEIVLTVDDKAPDNVSVRIK